MVKKPYAISPVDFVLGYQPKAKRGSHAKGKSFETKVKEKLESMGYHDFSKPTHRHCDWQAINRMGETVYIECKSSEKPTFTLAETTFLSDQKQKGKKILIAYKGSNGRIQLTDSLKKLDSIKKKLAKAKRQRRKTSAGTYWINPFTGRKEKVQPLFRF